MLALRYSLRWKLAGTSLLAIAIIGALVPEFTVWGFQFRIAIVQPDKMLHFMTFFFLAAWFSGQYSRRSYWRIAVGLVAFGALIELIQGMVSYRVSDWMDLYADGLGIAAGLTLALLGVGGWSLRVERWLDK